MKMSKNRFYVFVSLDNVTKQKWLLIDKLSVAFQRLIFYSYQLIFYYKSIHLFFAKVVTT